jgi:3-oxoacyl-[acyl-carrier-protein] synthase II
MLQQPRYMIQQGPQRYTIQQMQKVVITGCGAITPIGNTVPAFTQALFSGESGAGPITRFDATHYKTRFACEVKGFDPLQYISKTAARKYDLFSQFAIAAAAQAIQQSIPDRANIDANRVGVIIGAANGGSHTYESQIKEFALGNGTPAFNPHFIPMMMANAASANICNHFGFKGMNYTAVAACASSNIALADAICKIRYGQADMMIAGGAEASITEGAMGGFVAMRALSANNENASTASRPFDTTRDGFVIGEGAVMLVLESEEHALRRGATILAELAGCAVTSDAYHIAAPQPHGEGAFRGMTLALQDAGLRPAEVDLVSAHATSTPAGDLCEASALQALFGNHLSRIKVTAPKAAHGHLLGAAGAIGVLAALQAMALQQAPPTINTTQQDPAMVAPLPIVSQAEPHLIRVALCNSFGFGGHNATIICKQYVG